MRSADGSGTDWVRFVTMVADRGGLRTDRAPQELADELDVLHLPTNYERLTDNARWTLDTYTDYIFTNTCRILLPIDLNQLVVESTRSRGQGAP